MLIEPAIEGGHPRLKSYEVGRLMNHISFLYDFCPFDSKLTADSRLIGSTIFS